MYGRRADGEEFPIEATISQVTVGDQRLFTVILRDVTERVRAQESLRVAQMTLAPLLRSAGADPLGSGLTSVDVDPDGDGVFNDLRIKSDFNPMDGDVSDILEDVHVFVSNDTLWVRWQAGAANHDRAACRPPPARRRVPAGFPF